MELFYFHIKNKTHQGFISFSESALFMEQHTNNKKILERISKLPVYYCYEEKAEEPVLNINLSAENLRKLMTLFKTYIEDDKEDIKNNEYVFVSNK